MTTGDSRVQVELMLPHEIDAALAENSVAYLPLGTIEYHGRHLPVGLDGLTAHGVCARVAQRRGGIVLPTLFYGIGGGHGAYPWTIMAQSASTLSELLLQSLQRLSDFGVRTAVLFTGHFADEQLELVDTTASRWNAAGVGVRVVSLSVDRAGASVAADHAGVFETSLMWAMCPDRVQLDRLPDLLTAPSSDPGGDVQGPHRHDLDHPLHGVFGPDPRTFDPAAAGDLLEQVLTWTIAQVENHRPSTTAESGKSFASASSMEGEPTA